MNKRVVITGASSGIGLSFANKFASEGYDLVIVARNTEALKDLADSVISKYGVAVNVITVDLSVNGAADALWSNISKEEIDVFINNAGFGDLDDITTADPAKLSSMIAVNITSLTRLSQLAAIKMKNKGSGTIINIGSVLSFFPTPHGAVYGASKAYVLSYTEALSEELKGTGVYAIAICPGATQTNFAVQAKMENLGVMKGNLPSGDDVAAFGYRAFVDHKVVAVHTFRSKLITLAPRVITRSFMRRLSAKFQSQ